MITEYTVKYKLIGDLFWQTVHNVIGDDTSYRINHGGQQERPGEDTLPVRILFLKDNSRIELPINNCVIKFPKERHMMIKENIDKGKG